MSHEKSSIIKKGNEKNLKTLSEVLTDKVNFN